jgi:hypothetical protein
MAPFSTNADKPELDLDRDVHTVLGLGHRSPGYCGKFAIHSLIDWAAAIS